MLEVEANELALMSEIYGLGHLAVEGTVPLILPYATHPNEDIRHATTHALGQFLLDPSALAALVVLSADSDRDVRNWATFFIGTQSDADSTELREALARRLDDPFPDARQEAIAGLAKRKDERAVLPLLKLLRSGSYFVHHTFDFEALLDTEYSENGHSADSLIEALYYRFPALLPAR
jgi:HEAT repeat protein